MEYLFTLGKTILNFASINLNFLAGSEAIVDLAMLLLMWLRLVLLPNYVKN